MPLAPVAIYKLYRKLQAFTIRYGLQQSISQPLLDHLFSGRSSLTIVRHTLFSSSSVCSRFNKYRHYEWSTLYRSSNYQLLWGL